MKNFLEKTVTLQELDQVRCNCCGTQVKKNDLGYIADYLSVNKTWGYDSPIDGETHNFDLCFECYAQIVDRFQIPPESPNS